MYAFENGGDVEIFIGSADLMERNLDRRVEVLCPVLDPEIRHYLRYELLHTYLREDVRTTTLRADGQYDPMQTSPAASVDAQQLLMLQRPPGI